MKLLIAEDDLVTRTILKKIVEEQGYETLEAQNGYEAWKIFRREKDNIHIAFLDWLMPEMDGIELCRRIKKASVGHYVYILFLTSKQGIENIVEGLEAGGDDYMTKPFSRREIIARIGVAMRFINLEQQLRAANKKLNIMATTDSLTGLLNRRYLMERLSDEVFRAARAKNPCCLIMIDIDYFKRVNDTLGHTTGDSVLIETVDRIKAELRPYDIAGRYGGEEFLIGIPKADVETGKMVAERIRASISKKPFQIDGNKLDMTISLGITSTIPSGNKKDMIHLLENMIERADSALFRAKNAGRNRVILYGE